jgi:superfamily I DNA/RNA helicase
MFVMPNEHATGTADGIGQRDHSVTSEYWILGPPGTGKTTEISRQIRRAAEMHGPASVLVTSFSRAAAAELADCDLPIGPDRLGTLHSHCFHALGTPLIVEAHVPEWNRSNPHWRITSVKSLARLDGEDALEDDIIGDDCAGDSLLRELNRLRGLMVDREFWPAKIREFEREWARYKCERGLLDFCDLIEVCLREVDVAPHRPEVLFADEAQDLNVMQVKLFRKWGNHARYSVLALDDDQTIFSFIGAAPEAILNADIPDDHKIVLRQSHRVPVAVHQVANELIHRVTRREEKVYFPRAAAGQLHRLSTGTYKSPEYFILSSALKHLEHGKSVMFLASCSYMLRSLIQVLRKNAIPFHNPYRKANGLWNPLRMGRSTASRRIISLLVAHPEYGRGQRVWTHADLRLLTEWLRPEDVLQPGAKTLLQAGSSNAPVSAERLVEIFQADVLASLLSAVAGDWRALLHWWGRKVAPEFRNRIRFPMDVATKRGPHSLIEDPQVIVGTIHSVKGGQADVVYLFPDLSRAGDANYRVAGPPRDSVIRVFYVGATRARETLYICGRQTAWSVAI